MLKNELLVVSGGDHSKGDGFLGFYLLYVLLLLGNLGLLFLNYHPLILLLLRDILFVFVNHLVGGPVELEMIQVQSSYKLLTGQLECLLSNSAEFFIMFDDFPDVDPEFGIHLLSTHAYFVGHLLDDVDSLGEYFWLVLFHKGHEILDLFFLRLVDDHFVSIFHEGVEFLS